jgi:hypothetical protein
LFSAFAVRFLFFLQEIELQGTYPVHRGCYDFVTAPYAAPVNSLVMLFFFTAA